MEENSPMYHSSLRFEGQCLGGDPWIRWRNLPPLRIRVVTLQQMLYLDPNIEPLGVQ